MLPRLLINKTIFTGIALALFIFTIMIVVSYREMQKANNIALSIAHSQEILYQSTRILSTIADNETTAGEFILTGKNLFAIAVVKPETVVEEQIKVLGKLNKNNITRKPFIDLLSFYAVNAIRFADTAVEVKKQRGLDAAIELLSTGRGKLYTDNTRRIISQVQSDEQILLEQKNKAIAIQLKREQLIFIAIAFFIIGLLGILLWKERERKKQKERKKVREQVAMLSLQINQSHDAIYTMDAARKIRSWNRGAENLYGFTKEEALGKDPDILLKTGITSEEIVIALAEIDENDYWTGELKRQTKTGEIIYVRASATNIKNTGGDITGYVAVSFDITGQKKLGEEVNHLASIVEQSSEAIFSQDINGQIISWNRGAERLFGISREDAVGKTGAAINFRHLAPGETAEVENAIQEKGYWKSERDFFHADGYSFFGVITGNLLRNENDEIVSFNFIVKDISLRRQLEEQLKKTNTDLEQKVAERTKEIYISEKKYRYLFENNPLPMWVTEQGSFKFLDVNEMAIQHYGYSRNEFLSMTAMDIRPNENKKEFLQIDRSAHSNRAINNMGIWNHIKKDGTLMQVEIYAHQINFENKPATLILVNDVTEKIKADKKLTGNEKRFQAMIENNGEVINVVDGSYKILYRSPSAFRITGWTDEEILSQEGYVNIHPDDRDATTLVFLEVLANPGKPIYSLYRNLHKNGQYIWLEGVVTNLLHDENVRGFVANYRDVTERKKLQDLLNQANTLAIIGGWEIDVQKGTIYWTDITREIHETGPDYAPELDTAINFYKEGEGRQMIEQKVKEAIESGKTWDEELQIVTAKNNERWVRTIGQTEFINGKCVRVYGSFQDIDRRKQAEEQIKNANLLLEEKVNLCNEQLRKNNEQLEIFSYSLSHSIMQPLQNIAGSAILLLHPPAIQHYSDTAAVISAIKNNTVKINLLLNNLLALLKLEKQDFLKDTIDTGKMVEEALDEPDKTVEGAQKIRWVINPLPDIKADAATFRQVWINLLSGAAEAARTSSEPVVEVGSFKQGGEIIFYVKNTGEGFDEKYTNGLLKNFQIINEADKSADSGLQLFITQKIISRHSGRIWAEAITGGGGALYFTLPQD
jgi:PAS domain S-box-containing protein